MEAIGLRPLRVQCVHVVPELQHCGQHALNAAVLQEELCTLQRGAEFAFEVIGIPVQKLCYE